MINIIEVERFPITLAQFLKWGGIAMTGGEAKEIIKGGFVAVNDEVCLMSGKKLQPNDKVTLFTEEGNLNYVAKQSIATQ